MPTPLSKIKSQIAKLQKQAAAIESGIVARVRAEIEEHGLTVEQLFGKLSSAGSTAKARKTSTKKSAKTATTRAAKFADGQGNAWVGMGKRPQWIRDALEAGRSLDELLVGGSQAVSGKATPTKSAVKASAKVAWKAAPAKKEAASKKSTKAKKTASVEVAKIPARAKRVASAPAKKATAKKAVKATTASAVTTASAPPA